MGFDNDGYEVVESKPNDVESGRKKPAMNATSVSLAGSVGWWPLPEVKLPYWDPDEEKQWLNGGKLIATRNLCVSMPNLFCAFGVWLSWSVIVVKMQQMHDADPTVYAFKDWGSPTGRDYNFLLGNLPSVAGLSGGILRICNSFMANICGGRNVVYSNSIMLMIPMIMAAAKLSDPDVPYLYCLAMAVLSGVGGGAFASSMSNMSTLFPKTQQGYALGINGGLGNLGVSVSQLLLPVTMSWAAGDAPISELVRGWPNHAGYLWWPICLASSAAAFLWMSNNPDHGNHEQLHKFTIGCSVDTFWSHVYFYWIELCGLLTATVCTAVLVKMRGNDFFASSIGQIAYNFIIILFAVVLEHLVLWFASNKEIKESLLDQGRMFKDKHTYIMTVLYIMSFGSFIGFSGAFPKLIQDLFGYVTHHGCFIDGEFYKDGTEPHCIAMEGEWGTVEETNPDAPDVFRYAWLGAAFGSLIRPLGGILADRYGGANVTMLLIIWCVIATICSGILIQKIYNEPHPEPLFGWFVFMFINLFFTVGAMNGTTFGTIGVLFEKDLAGPVLGWSSAIASFGAYFIPSIFQVAAKYENAQAVMYGMAAFYTLCGCLNWHYYCKPGCEKPGV